jgi:hypothetical protein
MYKPTVRAVHRILLDTDRYGCITAGALDAPVQPFPQGAAIVLEVEDGWWMKESELERILPALSTVGHISITGRHVERKGGRGDFGIIYGLEAIARRLDELLTQRPLFETA